MDPMGTVPTDPVAALAHALAESPDLIAALLLEHRSDQRGYCQSCTTGGTGTRHTPAPCPLRHLAEMAARLVHERLADR
jgi:hypothetical protein